MMGALQQRSLGSENTASTGVEDPWWLWGSAEYTWERPVAWSRWADQISGQVSPPASGGGTHQAREGTGNGS